MTKPLDAETVIKVCEVMTADSPLFVVARQYSAETPYAWSYTAHPTESDAREAWGKTPLRICIAHRGQIIERAED